MDAVIKVPAECTKNELDAFQSLVEEGGEVTSIGLRKRIEQAEALVFIEDVGRCIAVGAIKNPNQGYKAKVFAKAGVTEQGADYKYELGWLYVSSLASGKGLGHRLMEAVTRFLSDSSCYATTRENNESMRHLFSLYSFNKLGMAYTNQNDYSLVLYGKKAIPIRVLSPSNLSSKERVAFEQMVLLGGQVNPVTLPGLIDRALALALAEVHGELVGVGAIKRPNKSHAKGVFQKANPGLAAENFSFELGWVFVAEAGRGNRLASRIVESLMPSLQDHSSYATSSVNNDKMHSSLRRFGYSQVGTPYPSKQNEPHIQLFVRA